MKKYTYRLGMIPEGVEDPLKLAVVRAYPEVPSPGDLADLAAQGLDVHTVAEAAKEAGLPIPLSVQQGNNHETGAGF
jgi:hypothetical protein